MTETKMPGGRATPIAAYAIVAALSAGLGFAAIYAMRAPTDNSTVEKATSPSQPAPQSNAGKPATGANPLSTGDMLTFVFKKSPEPLPEITFEDGTGAARTLSSFKGRVILLNLWATWCAPCRKEMPALDRLQAEFGGDRFEVLALSVDRAGAPASKKFLDETKVAHLKLYVESTSRSVGTLKAAGLPTTLLIDREGREVGRLAGPAEWDGEDAKRLIRSVLK
jgi:thiol-disulfide isomerase/thioredoxin